MRHGTLISWDGTRGGVVRTKEGREFPLDSRAVSGSSAGLQAGQQIMFTVVTGAGCEPHAANAEQID
jgi:hypothetical protein